MPTLSSLSTESFATLFFDVVCTHSTCRHGCGDPEIFKGQPAMGNVSELRRMKPPPALACVLLVTACTVPPCGHIMLVESFSNLPTPSPPGRPGCHRLL